MLVSHWWKLTAEENGALEVLFCSVFWHSFCRFLPLLAMWCKLYATFLLKAAFSFLFNSEKNTIKSIFHTQSGLERIPPSPVPTTHLQEPMRDNRCIQAWIAGSLLKTSEQGERILQNCCAVNSQSQQEPSRSFLALDPCLFLFLRSTHTISPSATSDYLSIILSKFTLWGCI